MADMKTILANMVRSIVEFPDEVVITEEMKGSELVLTLNVATTDIGKVIGRHGKIARSLRLVMKAAATRSGQKVSVDIR